MYKIHRYVYDVIFEKNMNMYNDFIHSVRKEYTDIITSLSKTQDTVLIRQLIHKLIGVIAFFEDTNCELVYYCRLILNIDKTKNDYSLYFLYIEHIIAYDKKQLGL